MDEIQKMSPTSFAGYCFCHKCGSAMRTVGSSGRHVYLRCLNAYSNNGCIPRRPFSVPSGGKKAILIKMSDDLAYMMARRVDAENPLPALQLKRDDLEKSNQADIGGIGNLHRTYRTLQRGWQASSHALVQVETEIKTVTLPSDHLRDREDSRSCSVISGGNTVKCRHIRRRVQDFLRRIISDVQFWCDTENDRPTVAVNFTNNTRLKPCTSM